MTSSLISLAAAEAEHHRELPMPPLAFGAIAFCCFLVLLAFLWSFRNTSADHRPQSGAEHGQDEQR